MFQKLLLEPTALHALKWPCRLTPELATKR